MRRERSYWGSNEHFNNFMRHRENKNNNMPENSFPRRSRLDLMTPAEKAIYDAMQEVEKAGADVRLTDAINLLSQARDKVADYVDGK